MRVFDERSRDGTGRAAAVESQLAQGWRGLIACERDCESCFVAESGGGSGRVYCDGEEVGDGWDGGAERG